MNLYYRNYHSNITSNYNTKNNSMNNSIRNYCQTLDTDTHNDLPLITSNIQEKYKLIKEKKNMNEKEFIQNTEDNIKSLEMEHQDNLLYHRQIVSGKIRKQSKKYYKRNEKYSK